MKRSLANPELSIVIPVYNESAILETSVFELHQRLSEKNYSFEIVLAENGSKDQTAEIANRLSQTLNEVCCFSTPVANYGLALRQAILQARGSFVICEEIDICNVDFHERAYQILQSDVADMVVGSKSMPGSHDQRPWVRRWATLAYNALLRWTLGFRGTDTHGLKAFQREKILAVIDQCIVEHDVFASELVIRAQRSQLRVHEIPVCIREKRAPSVQLFRRIPKVAKHIGQLWLSIHFGRIFREQQHRNGTDSSKPTDSTKCPNRADKDEST